MTKNPTILNSVVFFLKRVFTLGLPARINRIRYCALYTICDFFLRLTSFFCIYFFGSNLSSFMGVFTTNTTTWENFKAVVVGVVVHYAVLILVKIPLTGKRLHDMNLSWWWGLILFVPLAEKFVPFVLFAFPGTKEKNRFGSPPKPAYTLEAVLVCMFLPIYIATAILHLKGRYKLNPAHIRVLSKSHSDKKTTTY